MLGFLAALLAGGALSALDKEDDETIEKREKRYQYYEDYLKYYLDKARGSIADRAQEERNYYGYWPKVKNYNYSRKYLERPECVEGAVNLHYLDDRDSYEDYYDKVKRNININLISYEVRSGFEEIIKDEDILEEFGCEDELDY